jgi:hypothetical protein
MEHPDILCIGENGPDILLHTESDTRFGCDSPVMIGL